MNEPHLSDSIFGGDDPGDPSRSRPKSEAAPQERVRLPQGATPPPLSRRAARERKSDVRREDDYDSTARPARLTDERAPRQRRSPILPLLLAVVLVFGGGFLAVKALGLPSFGGGGSDQPSGGDFAGEGTGAVDITVERGDTGGDIGATLEKAGVVKAASTFARVFATEPEAARIQPGSYTLKKQMSSSAALTALLDPAARTGGVTIREGLWASEIYSILSKATKTPLQDYKNVKPDALGLPEGAEGRVEGFLFPSTYDFAKGLNATGQLKAMVAEFKRQTAPLNIPADQVRRTVIMASLVQAESRLGEDGPKVARVIENRLKPDNPGTVGRLQLDSTVHYLEQKRGTVTTTAGERQNTSPYNTYLAKGLPPGPVDNPGLEALKAARAPAAGNWLYFVTINQETGETRFTADYNEHLRNVAVFRKWCQDNKGKC